jgi:ferric-dicitrate binding protein FerR (iron transport regulator)
LSLGRLPEAVSGEPLARLTRAETPGLVELRSFWRESAVDAGADVRPGQQLEARGSSLLALRVGGNLRVATGTEFEVVSGNTVQLDHGELYVDIPPGTHAAEGFVAITDAGEFRHVGTQFALAVSDGATRLRVREGSVSWRAGDTNSSVSAGTEVYIDRNGEVTRSALQASGEQWAWMEKMAPEFEIDGQPLSQFLEWVARETGRKLVITDEATRVQVSTIRTHGNVQGLVPLQALEAVMASTSLHLELPAGTIRVSYPGASPPRQ